MNKKALLLLSVACAPLCHSAKAMELWDQHVRATDVGEYSGMLPPKGVYFIDNNIYAGFNAFDENSKKIHGTSLTAYINAPILLWSTGLTVLGGSYAVGIAQPFDYTSSAEVGPGAGNLGLYNTVLVPGIISWNLSPLFVSAGLSVYLPDGTNNITDLVHGKMNNGGLPSANAFASIEPDLGLTYMFGNGWSASASFHLAFPLGSTTTTVGNATYDYHSGDLLMGDYTIGKTLGSWTLGVGGATQNQLTHDKQTGTLDAPAGGNVQNYSLSAFASYQFQGGISLAGIYSHGLSTTNDVGGDIFNLRIVTAF